MTSNVSSHTSASYYFDDICPTGNSYQSLEYQYSIGRTTMVKIIPYTCSAIYLALKDKYIKTEHLRDSRRSFLEVHSLFVSNIAFRSRIHVEQINYPEVNDVTADSK